MGQHNNSVWLIACRPSGIIAILLWFCIALMMSSNASAANVVLNGDFETGDFSNWVSLSPAVVNAISLHSGSYGCDYNSNIGQYQSTIKTQFIYQTVDLTNIDTLSFYYAMPQCSITGNAWCVPALYLDNVDVWGGSASVTSYTYKEYNVSAYSGNTKIGFGFVAFTQAGSVDFRIYYDDIIAEAAEPELCSIVFNPNVSISNQTQQYFDYNVNSTWDGYMYFVTSVWHAPYNLPDLYLIENWLNVEQEGENVPLDNPFSDLQTYHLNLYATTSAPPVVSESFLIASSNNISINRSYTGSIPPIPDPEPEPDPYEPDPNPIDDPNTTIPDDWNMTIPDKYQNVSWLTNYTGYFDDLTSSVNNTLYSVTGLVIKPLQSLNETVYILRYHISNSKNMVAEYSYLSVIAYCGWAVLPVEMQTIFIGVAAAGACIYLFKRRT